MFGKKRKAIDPNKIPQQVLIMEAELKTTEKKLSQQQEQAERQFMNAFKEGNSYAMKEYTTNVFKAEAKLSAFPVIRSALKELKSCSKEISSHACDDFEHEDAFRIVLIAGKYFQFESGKKLIQIARELYPENFNAFLNESQLNSDVKKGLFNEGPSQADLNVTMQNICQRKMIDVGAVEAFLGYSLSLPPQAAFNDPNQMNAPLPSESNSLYPPLSSDIKTIAPSPNNQIYTPINVPVFERSNWPQIIQAVREATQ